MCVCVCVCVCDIKRSIGKIQKKKKEKKILIDFHQSFFLFLLKKEGRVFRLKVVQQYPNPVIRDLPFLYRVSGVTALGTPDPLMYGGWDLLMCGQNIKGRTPAPIVSRKVCAVM